jgi:hypothetical protein
VETWLTRGWEKALTQLHTRESASSARESKDPR